MRNNLPVVDAALYASARDPRAAIERCPTGAIVWLDPAAGPRKGAAARKVVRIGARREAAT
jgi:hypothetical protein